MITFEDKITHLVKYGYNPKLYINAIFDNRQIDNIPPYKKYENSKNIANASMTIMIKNVFEAILSNFIVNDGYFVTAFRNAEFDVYGIFKKYPFVLCDDVKIKFNAPLCESRIRYIKKHRFAHVISKNKIQLSASFIAYYNSVMSGKNKLFKLKKYSYDKFLFDQIKIMRDIKCLENVKRNIIFLDIDGVLNSVKNEKEHHFVKLNNKRTNDCFNKSYVKNLNNITNLYGFDIVLTSSWRTAYTVDELKSIFTNQMGVHAEILDITSKKNLSQNRCDEIREWLSENKYDIENFIIIDDSSDAGIGFEDVFFKIDNETGLSNIEANKIICKYKKMITKC